MKILINNKVELPILRLSETITLESGVNVKSLVGRFYYDLEIDSILDDLIQNNPEIDSLKMINDMNKIIYENNDAIFIQLKERDVSPSGDFIIVKFKKKVDLKNNE